MKTPVIILFLTFAAYFSSCSRADQSVNEAGEVEEVKSTGTNTIEQTEKVFDIPTLKSLFVTSHEGVHLYEEPNRQSVVLETLEYGYRVEVIGEQGEWYQIKERISRSFIRNGNQIRSTGWEIVNIPKQDVGELTQIKLRAADLYLTYDNAPVQGKIELKLIDEAEFNKARNMKEGFIIKRENLVSTQDTVLTVALGNGTKKVYVSTPSAEDQLEVYAYAGHIRYLGAYLLAIGYYEGGECMLYDAANGEEIISFNDYPEISPDGRYIVSMYTNPYDQSTDLQLHSVGHDKTIRKELEASFSNWMVALEPYEVYWVDDNTLVLKVIHARAFWDEAGNLNDDAQYLKLKIL